MKEINITCIHCYHLFYLIIFFMQIALYNMYTIEITCIYLELPRPMFSNQAMDIYEQRHEKTCLMSSAKNKEAD